MIIATSHGVKHLSAEELFVALEELYQINRHGVGYYKGVNPKDKSWITARSLAEFLSPDPLAEKALAVIRAVDDLHKVAAEYAQTVKESRQYIARNAKQIRSNLSERDGSKCKHCGSTHRLEIDHIKALSRGGTNDFANLQLLCRTCNMQKGTK